MPAPLVPGVGLAVLVVVAGLLTVHPRTAPAAVPVCAALAAAGLSWATLRSAWPRRRLAAAYAALGAAATAVAAGPVLLTGQGGLPGYYRLDDSATWLLTADHVLRSGRQVPAVATSTAEQVLQTWLGSGYPVGSFLPLGISGRLAGVDLAAAYGPVLAATSAVLALALAGVAVDYLRSPVLAAAAGLVGAQASLLVAYTAWGGIKEVTAAALIAVLAASGARVRSDVRAVVPVGISAGALLQVLGPGGAAWSAPALLSVVVLVAARSTTSRTTLGELRSSVLRAVVAATAAVAVVAVAAVPAVAASSFLVHARGGGVLVRQDELGNLVAPVPLLHAAGLWPTADPLRPGGGPALTVLAVLVLLAAGGAFLTACAARRPAYPVYAVVAAAGALPAVAVGSPWVDAKVLAMISPVVLLGAVLLVLGLSTSRVRPVGLAASVLAAVLGACTAWSWWQTGQGTTSAPVERFADLHRVAGLVGAEGPGLVLDPEIYAARWYLRHAEVVGAGDLRPVRVPLRDGSDAAALATLDVGAVEPAALHRYRTLLRRASPSASRPPAAYALVAVVGEWEVWRRGPDDEPPLAVLELAQGADPAAVPDCEQVLALAGAPDVRVLQAVPRDPLVVAPVDLAGAPPPWRRDGYVQPDGTGTMDVVLEVPRGGRWQVWVGGSVPGQLRVEVDGAPVGQLGHELAHGSPWLPVGTADVEAGRRVVRLHYSETARTGTALRFPLGPVALTPSGTGPQAPVLTVPASEARQLCDGRAYDWVAGS